MDNQTPGLGTWLMLISCALALLANWFPVLIIPTGIAVVGGGAVALRDVVQWLRGRIVPRVH